MTGGLILAWLAFNGGFAAGALWCSRNNLSGAGETLSRPYADDCAEGVMDRTLRAPVGSVAVNSLRHGGING